MFSIKACKYAFYVTIVCAISCSGLCIALHNYIKCRSAMRTNHLSTSFRCKFLFTKKVYVLCVEKNVRPQHIKRGIRYETKQTRISFGHKSVVTISSTQLHRIPLFYVYRKNLCGRPNSPLPANNFRKKMSCFFLL